MVYEQRGEEMGEKRLMVRHGAWTIYWVAWLLVKSLPSCQAT